MKKYFAFLGLFALLLSFNGCVATGLYWSSFNTDSGTIIKEDKIYAFAKSKTQTKQIDKDSLIMLGEKYWYVLSPKDSKDLHRVLKVKLPEAFYINAKYGYNSLPVKISNKKGKFHSDFCLEYKTDYSNYTNILKELNFKIKNKKIHRYEKCFKTEGRYFVAQKDISKDYTFENKIYVHFYSSQSHIGAKTSNIAQLILATPLTVALDIILIPAYLDRQLDKHNN